MKKNFKRGLAVMAAGIVIAVLAGIGGEKGTLRNDGSISRNEYGEGEKPITLIASGKDAEATIYYNIAERIYSEDELESMLPECKVKLEEMILGTNESAEEVRENLNFVSALEGYPFDVSIYTDNSDLVGYDGSIREEVKKKEYITITAELEYQDYIFYHSFPVCVCPPLYSSDELWKLSVEDALEKSDSETAAETYLTLPSEVNNEEILWREEKSGKGMKIMLLSWLIGGYFFFADRLNERNRLQKRKEQIKKEFPEFALKCSMLTDAGMTMRQVFQKIALSHKEGKTSEKKIYEEVMISVREMENGVPERTVYQNFGRRCGIRETEKFGNVVARNLRQGADGLANILREEAAEAMNMQRELIRKKGETAGTKLLFPMLILLLLVMVIIMVPAFGNFSI